MKRILLICLLALTAFAGGVPNSAVVATWNQVQVSAPPSIPTIGWWRMSEGTGITAADSSGNGNTMALVGMPIWGSGTVGGNNVNFLTFNGSSQNGSVPDAAVLNPLAETVCVWVNAAALTAGYSSPFSKELGYTTGSILYIKSNGKLAIYLYTGSSVTYDGSGSHTLITGTWYFVSYSYDSISGLIGYVNGVQDRTVAANGTISPATGSSLDAALDPGTPSTYLDGSECDLRVFNSALTPTQIMSIYTAGPQ